MTKRLLFGLFVLAAQLEKNKSGAEILPIDDPDRTYSYQDKKARQYIKKIDGSFGDFQAAITKYNLEALEYLQKKGWFSQLLLPEIKITQNAIVSKLFPVDAKNDYENFVSFFEKEFALQVKVDLALASILGIAGDLAPTNIPESKGEVNAQVTENGQVQILDIDDLGLEIESMELFLYGTNSFKVALEFLKNPDLKAIPLQRLKKIFPNNKPEMLQAIFDEKIRLLQEAVEDENISAFFQNLDNIYLIRQIQNSETPEEQQQKLQELEKESPNTHKWLIEIQKFNNKLNQFVGNSVVKPYSTMITDRSQQL